MLDFDTTNVQMYVCALQQGRFEKLPTRKTFLTIRTVYMLVGLSNRLDMSVKFMVFSLCKYIFFNIFCSLMFSVEVCFFMIRLWKNSICGKNVFPMTAEYESHLQMMLHCTNEHCKKQLFRGSRVCLCLLV